MNYFKRPELSNSDIKLLLKSPDAYLNKEFSEPTDAMILGTALHCYILENDAFKAHYSIKPVGLSLATKEGKLWRDSQTNTIISESDVVMFETMRQNILKHPYSFLLTDGKREIEKEYYFNYNGIDCRSKIDMVNHDYLTIIDLKSISDCSRAENVTKYENDTQSTFYKLALRNQIPEGLNYDFVFIYTEKTYPFGCKFIQLSEWSEMQSLGKIHKAMEIYNNLENLNYFGYDSNIITV